MKTWIAIAAALALSGTSTVTAQSSTDGQRYEKGAKVTLQGCVVAGEKEDTWVLTNVSEWPASGSDMGKYGKRYYWLDKLGKDLRGYGGHTIQVVGKIDEVEKSEIELKKGDDGMGMTVEIEGPGNDIRTTAANADVKPSALPNTNDIPITLLKVKVDEIKRIASNCNAR